MLLLDNGKVTFQADTGKYLSRIAFSNNAVDSTNYIMAEKDAIDDPSQFEYDYDPSGGPWKGAGTITLKANNGRYWSVSSGVPYIKPVSTESVEFIILDART